MKQVPDFSRHGYDREKHSCHVEVFHNRLESKSVKREANGRNTEVKAAAHHISLKEYQQVCRYNTVLSQPISISQSTSATQRPVYLFILNSI